MQLFTGKLSDRVGRGGPIVAGMLLCAFGVVLILASDGLVYWSACSALIGLGMALLYPNLSAAIADLAHPQYHAATLGIYRFWRDSGYSVAGLFFALVSLTSARVTDGFILVSVAMTASAIVVGVYYYPLLKARKVPK
jgi:MFS family permease